MRIKTAPKFLPQKLPLITTIALLLLTACVVDPNAPDVTPVLPVTVVMLPTATPRPTATRRPIPTPAIEVYLHEGAVYLYNKEWDAAVAAYRRAAELDPDSFEIRAVLGYIYAQQGKYELAEPELLKANELRPNDYHTLKNLALTYDHLARFDAALTYAQQAHAIAPEEDRAALERFIQYLQTRQEP